MPDFGRAISDTCYGEKEKCKGGRGVMPNTFEAKMRPFMSVMKISCLVTIFSFRLLFLSISEYTLLI